MNALAIAIFAAVGVVAVVALIGLFSAFPIMWCWNYTMPHLFELNTLTWGQAWCLNFLCGSLIKASQTNNNNK